MVWAGCDTDAVALVDPGACLVGVVVVVAAAVTSSAQMRGLMEPDKLGIFFPDAATGVWDAVG